MSGVGADISGDALKAAKENGKRLGIDAIWKQGDLFEALGTTEEVRSETYRFDLIRLESAVYPQRCDPKR